MSKHARLTDLEKARLRKDYLADLTSSKTDLRRRLAVAYGIGESTLRLYAKQGDWDTLREATRLATGGAIAQSLNTNLCEPIPVAGALVNINELLRAAISDAAAAASTTEAKSKEGLYRALVAMLELWNKRHPATVDELLDAFESTGQPPQVSAQRVKERLNR